MTNRPRGFYGNSFQALPPPERRIGGKRTVRNKACINASIRDPFAGKKGLKTLGMQGIGNIMEVRF
jgi:hypothetical protein